jgi:lysine/ornithine N-monooxygenase
MKQTAYESDFRDAFRAHDRAEQFTYEGLGILFDYLEQYEQDTGEEIELDVIALCCEYAESTPEDIADDYSIMDALEADEDDKAQIVMDWLCDHTSVCGQTSTGAIVFCTCF